MEPQETNTTCPIVGCDDSSQSTKEVLCRNHARLRVQNSAAYKLLEREKRPRKPRTTKPSSRIIVAKNRHSQHRLTKKEGEQTDYWNYESFGGYDQKAVLDELRRRIAKAREDGERLC